MIRTQTLWADSPAVDVLLFLAPVLLVPLPHLLHVDQGLPILGLAMGVKFLFDLPHLASCWTRTILDPTFRKDHPLQIFGGVPLIVLATVLLGAQGRLDILIGGLFFLAVPHGLLQVVNLLACYRHREGESGGGFRAVFESALVVLIPVALLLGRLSGNLEKTILDIEIPHAWIFPWMVQSAWALAMGALMGAIWFEIRAYREGRSVSSVKWVFIGSVAAAYWILSKIPSLQLATLGYLCWHSAQYVALTFLINRNRARVVRQESAFLWELFRPGRGAYYAAAIFFHGVIVYLALAAFPRLMPAMENASLVWAVAVLYALSFSHFLLDITLMAVPRYALVRTAGG